MKRIKNNQDSIIWVPEPLKGKTIKLSYGALYEKVITKFGSGAKIDAPKEFLGKRVYILIKK